MNSTTMALMKSSCVASRVLTHAIFTNAMILCQGLKLANAFGLALFV